MYKKTILLVTSNMHTMRLKQYQLRLEHEFKKNKVEHTQPP